METIISKSDINQNYQDLKKKFKNMLKGSNMAKYLSVCYAAASFTYAFKFRDELLYCIPLIAGGIVVLIYAIKFLWLKGVNEKARTGSELVAAIKEYKKQTLKRENYESFVMAFWLLTLIPVYLEGKDISPILVMKIIAVFYLFTFLGNYLFNQAKEQIKEMDMLANQIDC